MWIFIWVLLTAFVLGITAWQVAILYQQKNAWKLYAKKHDLKYDKGTLFGPPQVTGDMNGHALSLFTDAQQTNDIRGQRFITAVEIELGEGMPTGAAIATPEVQPFIDNLVFDQTFTPDFKDWNKDYVLRTRDQDALKKYLSHERLEALHKLFQMKGAVVLFFFDELAAVLRIETTDPLREAERMEKVLGQIIKLSEKLALSEKEKP